LFVAAITAVSAELNVPELVNYAAQQYTRLAASIPPTGEFISTGNPASPTWTVTDGWPWTVGFYAGSLWMLYKHTGDTKWRDLAEVNQEGFAFRQFDTGTHDLGFVVYVPYGHGLELTGNQDFVTIINNAAKSLATRFELPGVFRSWNNGGQDNPREVKVIIDNMMNLELMFKASLFTGNKNFWDMAVSHADNTIREHYRPDWGTYHVVAYDDTTGAVLRKYTGQGYAADSTWARGHAWGIYGYTTTYKYTGDIKYLEVAENAAEYYIDHLPEDLVPFWDFQAPNETSYQPRDTSAASIVSCAFLELYEVTGKALYLDLADRILNSLINSSYFTEGIDAYQIPSILVNGTVHYTNNDFNTAITYGDYYFLKALDLYKNLA